MQMNKDTKSFMAVAMGVAFEHLDMMLVSLLASSMVEEFIGSRSTSTKLFYAYMGYAIAFVFRPLGALCFGFVGDLYGRKKSLLSSMSLMVVATLTLSFLPGAQMLGMASSIIFILCRIAQGLAVGGEYGSAMTYAYELKPHLRTFYGACVVSSTHVGGLFASFIASQYVENFRVAFLIGGLVGILLVFFRSLMKEYHKITTTNTLDILIDSVKNKNAILEALIIASMLVLVFYGSLIYINEIIYQNFAISRAQIFKANTLLLSLWVVLPPCVGYFADKFMISYLKIMIIGAMGVFLSAPLLGIALDISYQAVLAAQILLHIFHMLFCLCTPRFFGDLFSNQGRNTAICISYSLGASFTAALAPMICHTSVILFHTTFAICIPFMLISLAVIFILKKDNLCKKMILSNSMT